jgi:hypothetical protein
MEFAKVLLVGLIILAFLYFGSEFFQEGPTVHRGAPGYIGGYRFVPTPPTEEFTLVAGERSSRRISVFGGKEFSTNPIQVQLLGREQIEVRTSIFEQKIAMINFSIAGVDIIASDLGIEIISTNALGKLKITLNNHTIYYGIPDSLEKSITLPLDVSILEEKNRITVVCDGPGLRFWATNYYILAIKVSAQHNPFFTFSAKPEEQRYFKMARVLVFVKEAGSDNLTVAVNGEEIYSGTPERYLYADFYSIRRDNIISFSGSGWNISADVIIFWESSPTTYEREFTIARVPAKLQIRIERVIETPNLIILQDGKKIWEGPASVGLVTVPLKVKEGRYKFGLSASGIGEIEISAVRII